MVQDKQTKSIPSKVVSPTTEVSKSSFSKKEDVLPRKKSSLYISVDVHQEVIKWLSIVYILNSVLFFILFVIVYIYK